MIYVLKTYILNNTSDHEALDIMSNTLKTTLNESAMKELNEAKISHLAMAMKVLVMHYQKTDLTEFSNVASKIYLDKLKVRLQSKQADQ